MRLRRAGRTLQPCQASTGFNGAAVVRLRRGRKSHAPDHRASRLQRSRSRETAERKMRSGKLRREAHCFNGAAVVRLRREVSLPGLPPMAALLQRSRSRETAESCLERSESSRGLVASTEPQS